MSHPLKEFLENYNYAPYELREVAEIATEVTDSEVLSDAAKKFLEAEETLESVLEEIGYEFG